MARGVEHFATSVLAQCRNSQEVDSITSFYFCFFVQNMALIRSLDFALLSSKVFSFASLSKALSKSFCLCSLVQGGDPAERSQAKWEPGHDLSEAENGSRDRSEGVCWACVQPTGRRCGPDYIL